VRLMPPAYVKPYVKRQKNDATDAEAICEAVTRANMRFVPTKTRAAERPGAPAHTPTVHPSGAGGIRRRSISKKGTAPPKGRTARLWYSTDGLADPVGAHNGFSFAMAVNRYDERKKFEVAEVNAIGIEYLRADLLPSGDAAHVRALLRQYISQRIVFYLAADERCMGQIDAETKKLQADLWSTVVRAATTQIHPL
jgi:hypothetical protein